MAESGGVVGEQGLFVTLPEPEGKGRGLTDEMESLPIFLDAQMSCGRMGGKDRVALIFVDRAEELGSAGSFAKHQVSVAVKMTGACIVVEKAVISVVFEQFVPIGGVFSDVQRGTRVVEAVFACARPRLESVDQDVFLRVEGKGGFKCQRFDHDGLWAIEAHSQL